MPVIPKEEPKKEGSTLSFWVDADFADELRKAAEVEGLKLSKLVGHLVKAGWKQYGDEKERAAASKKKR